MLTPGLVNTHLHLEQSFPDRVAKPPQTPFSDWLLQVVAKLAARATPAERRARCVVGADELLKTGATCVNDIASGPDSV
ncbi:amidohydrolase family protein, partial [Acinetobacter baumannii]